MKSNLLVLFLLIALLTLGACSSGGDTGTTVYAIGDFGPSGVGRVFYITDGGAHGFEAAPNTWSGGTEDPALALKNANTVTANADGTGLGDGAANTAAMMLDAANHPAAAACVAYTGGSLSGWFMPSVDELNEMHLQRSHISPLLDNYYWTSTHLDASFGYYQEVVLGGQWADANKTEPLFVRPIRAF